jgi:gluconolactonase
MRRTLTLAAPWLLAVCAVTEAGAAETVGKVTRYSPALDAIIAPDARIEKLAEGFTWSEGPVWITEGNYLLFTDVPGNVLYRWTSSEGAKPFLEPSGFQGADTSGLREPGANGLFPDKPGWILVANAGNRTVDRLELATKRKTLLASRYNGKKLNSPNDVTRKRDGTLYFTDPPYSLQGINDSPLKELPFNGVYRLGADGKLTLLDDSLSFPNGLGLSPDERTLYVANSDPKQPIWMAYTLDAQGNVTGKRVFADASDLMGAGVNGLPDGMKVSAQGDLYASAPGGVLIMSPDGKRLGRIETGTAIANCAFGDDGRTLYLTSNHFLARIRLLVKGR